MTHHEALAVLAKYRQHQVVISSMTSVGIWPTLSDHPLDFHYLPSSMGQAVALGLGLAVGSHQPTIVLSGDGSLMMNLGALATVADTPCPLTIIVFDNGMYSVTGGQPVVGAGRVDWAMIAQGCGIKQSFTVASIEAWDELCPKAISQADPVFVAIKVDGEFGQKTPKAPIPMADQIKRLKIELAKR